MVTETETESIERELSASVDGPESGMRSDSVLDTLTTREENRLQMQEMRRRTVRPGLMRLSVDSVGSAENSEQYYVDIDHPIRADDDPIRVFLEKPKHGWSRDYKLVRVLKWYGIEDDDPHKLEFENVYVEQSEESEYAHGWKLVEPPEYKYRAPMSEQIARKRYQISKRAPERTDAKMWGLLLLSTIVSSGSMMFAESGLLTAIVAMLVSTLVFLLATLAGIMFMQVGGEK